MEIDLFSYSKFKKQRKPSIAKAWFLSSLLFSLSAVAQETAKERGGWHTFQTTAMTTHVELELFTQDSRSAQVIADDVFQVFHQIDQGMSRYKPQSELSRINKLAAHSPVRVSASLYFLLEKAQQYGQLSHGAFDISFASVGFLYDYRSGKQPDSNDVSRLADAINFSKIRLNKEAQTVELLDTRMVLDLGGIAKGYAVDLGIALLKSRGVVNARLSAGGDMRLLGDKRGTPWMVGIQDPRNPDSQAVILPLSEVAISTSGDYERFFINEAGERIHHILSPDTGKPAKGIQSVTVIGPAAVDTDALSTAVFVMGLKSGLQMINGIPEVDAIIVDGNHRLHYSDGLAVPE